MMDDVAFVKSVHHRKRRRTRSKSDESNTSSTSTKASSSDDTDLPPFWIVCNSSKLNRKYYFNKATGESIWEHPNSRKNVNTEETCSTEPTTSNDKSTLSSILNEESEFTSPLKRGKCNCPQSSSSVINNASSDLRFPEAFISNPVSTNQQYFGASFSGRNNNNSFDMESVECLDDILDEPMDVDQEVSKLRTDFHKPLTQPVSFVNTESVPWDISFIRQSSNIYLIMDTNIFISHLPFIRSLRNYRSGSRTAIIVVPYVVLQELDVLKDNSKYRTYDPHQQSDLSSRTSDAINFIYKEMNNKSTFLLCQPSSVDAEPVPNLHIERNDDRILKCCYQLNKKIDDSGIDSIVLVCSNDKNLLTKAAADNLASGTQSTIEVILQEFHKKAEKFSKITLEQNQHKVRPSTACAVPNSVSTTMPDLTTAEGIFEYARIILSQIVECEFNRVYKNNAFSIYVLKPPWLSLKVVIEVIIKHWVAVFRYVWKEQQTLDRIHSLFQILIKKSKTTVDDWCEAMKLLCRLLEPFTQQISFTNGVAINRILKALRNYVEQNDDSAIVPEFANPVRGYMEEAESPPTVISNDPVDAAALNKMEKVCSVVWSFIDDSKYSLCSQLLTVLNDNEEHYNETKNSLKSFRDKVEEMSLQMETVFQHFPDLDKRYDEVVEVFCFYINGFLALKLKLIEPQVFLEPGVFKEFFAKSEKNRITFVEAAGHLNKLIKEMDQYLISF